jgi:lipopolysaccharide/colanic/teichoic acid biosynthesis glycosyltransferase
MTIMSSDAAAGNSAFGGGQRVGINIRFRKPSFIDGFVFGFLFRFITGMVAAIMSSAVLFVTLGLFGDAQLTEHAIFASGVFVAAIVFIGEHFRSQAFERVVLERGPRQDDDPTHRLSWSQLESNAGGRNKYGRAALVYKRSADIALALGGLVALMVPITLVAILIKLDSRGPVFYRKYQRGFDGRIIRMYKFRTIELTGQVTAVGNWLRRSSIDELPVLLNVLRGEMSLVGPQPQYMYFDLFAREVAALACRYGIKPGIIGWAQVHGFTGEAASVESIRREYDLWYIQNWSPWLDVRIMLKAVARAVRPH